MKETFKNRVISRLKREGWAIKYNAPYPIDFFSVRPHSHNQKAYRVKSHGHLSHKEQNVLYLYGKQTGMHVLYTHESEGHEIEFVRLYPKNLKTEGIR